MLLNPVSLLLAVLAAALSVWPLSLPVWGKASLTLLLLAASQFHAASRLSSGSVFAPEFPRPVVVAWNWAIGTIALAVPCQLILLGGAAALALAEGGRAGLPDAARLSASGLAGLLAAAGVLAATRVPPLRDQAVTIAGLDPAFDGYRVLHLTDLHLSRLFPARWAGAVVDRANGCGASLIVVTGDFIDGSVAMRRDDVAPLRALRAPDGVLAVPGNHEYFFDYDAWMRHLSALGLRMLPNAHAVIRRGEASLVVAGVTDASAPRRGQPGPDLDAALCGAPPGAPVLLLDHQPRNARQTAARGIALQLSGHTHGGMAIGLDRLVARGNNGFVSGRYRVDGQKGGQGGGQGSGMTLLVGNGTGIWPGFALRLGRPSEMIRITLRAGRADRAAPSAGPAPGSAPSGR